MALVEIYERHTGEHLKKLIKDTLAKFDIPVENVYTLTTDSGANMVKAVSMLNEEGVGEKSENSEDDEIEDCERTDLEEYPMDVEQSLIDIERIEVAIHGTFQNCIGKYYLKMHIMYHCYKF